MNRVILIGNVARDIETHTTQGGVKRADFTLAVNRQFKNAQGQREADFIRCVTWREKADFAEKYLAKGKKIAVVGTLQVRSYDTQDGQKRTIYEVVVDELEFVTPAEKGVQNGAGTAVEQTSSMAEYADPSLPF